MRLGNKRAEWTMLQIMMILGGIIVAFVLVSIVLRITSKDRAESEFFAKDAALLADAVLSTPQDVQIIYPREFAKQYVRLENMSIAVFIGKPQPDESSPHTYYFVPRKGISVEENEMPLSAFFMLKSNGILAISNVPLQKGVTNP
jgi:hypothetical protein